MPRKLLCLALLLCTGCANAIAGDESPGPSKFPKQFAIAPAEAHHILSQTGVPPLVFGSEDPDFEISAAKPDRVIWILRKEGGELFRYEAALRPVDARTTEVKLELDAPTKGPYGNIEARLEEKPEVRRLYLAAMEEQVAAALERRPFDRNRIYPDLLKLLATNIGSIGSWMRGAPEADRRQSEDKIERAYAEEAAGRWP